MSEYISTSFAYHGDLVAFEQRILAAEGRTLEARIEARLDALDARLAGIEEHLRRRAIEDDTRAQ
jgi:hypothetical protein